MTNGAHHRFVLTGASGLLGQNFLPLVTGSEFQGLCLLRQQSRQSAITAPNIHFVRLDVEDLQKISMLLEDFKPTAFIHAAAAGNQPPAPDWSDLVRFNVDISAQYCRLAARIPGCRFIHVGTGLVYRDQGRPLIETDPIDTLHPYGASKAAGDIVVQAVAAQLGVPSIILRPFSFTGPGDDQGRLFPSILLAAAQGKPVKLSPGGQRRDFSSVHDMARAVLAAVLTDEPSRDRPAIYNLGCGSNRTLKEVIEDIVQQLELDVDLRFGERSYAPHEPMCLVADTAAARKDLGWHPTHSLVQAVEQLIKGSFPQVKYETRERLHFE